MVIRPYEPSRDAAFMRRCVIELQETERLCDPHLPSGESMVDVYLAVVHERCNAWHGQIWVAEVESAPAGVAILYGHVPSTEPDEPPGTYALLSDLVVAAECRGRGIGMRLLQHAEAQVTARGGKVLRLEVMAENVPAVSLYRHAGYRSRLLQLEKRFGP